MKSAYLNWKKDLNPYLENYPLMSNKPGELPDGNAVLYSSIAIIIHTRMFGQEPWAIKWVSDLYDNCRIAPGIISRGRHKYKDTQEHDDYIGLMAASKFSGYLIPAKEIYRRGMENNWVYDEGVYKSSNAIGRFFENWYARFPGFTDHAAICAGEKASLVFIDLSFPFWKISAGSAQLDWVRKEAYRIGDQKCSATDYAVSLWEGGIRKHRRDLMGSVFAEYYNEAHPFAKWMRGLI